MNDQIRMIRTLERHQWVIDEQAKDITQADSLLQLPFRSNCFNWVLGHIVAYRDKMLALLGESPVTADEEMTLYRRGSQPLMPENEAVDIDILLAASRQALQRLGLAIKDVSDERLDTTYDEERGSQVRDRLEFLIWHEAYHLGQLEILRQLAGKDDAII